MSGTIENILYISLVINIFQFMLITVYYRLTRTYKKEIEALMRKIRHYRISLDNR